MIGTPYLRRRSAWLAPARIFAISCLSAAAACVDVSRETLFSADCNSRKLEVALETRESISVTLRDFLLLLDDDEVDRLGGPFGRKDLPVKATVLAAIPRRTFRPDGDNALVWRVYVDPERHSRAAFDALSACLAKNESNIAAALAAKPPVRRALIDQMSDRDRLVIGAALYANYAKLSERYCQTGNPGICVHVAPGGEVSLEEKSDERFSAVFIGRTTDGRVLRLEPMGQSWVAEGDDPTRYRDAAGRALNEAYRIEQARPE